VLLLTHKEDIDHASVADKGGYHRHLELTSMRSVLTH